MDSAKQQTENPATNWARYRRFALALVTLGIFLVSLIYSFVKTQAVEERIGNQVTTTMWLVSQAEIEFLRFMTMLPAVMSPSGYKRTSEGYRRGFAV